MKLFSEQLQKNRKGARGFTLVEILIVVALIVILLAVSVAGLMKLRKNIRQRELDSKAEIIYMAAQHRLTALKTGGFQKLYTPEGNSDVFQRTGRPFDAAEDNDQADKVCYVKSSLEEGHIDEDSGAASILPVSSVDRQLWDNHWVIEFCPETGAVYAVFYSEEPIREVGEELELRLDGLRVKQLRLEDGARIGYYGGDLTSITLSDALVPDIDVENAEKLKVTFSSRVPKPMKLKFTIYIYDENNEPNWNNLASEQEQKKVCIKKITPKLSSAASYKHEWILDSLDPKEGSFYKNTEGKIPAGANICIKLKVEEDTEGSLIAPKSITVTDNGIFAYRQDGKKNTAYIAYGRHLQNLHPKISMLGEKAQGGPGAVITSAIQVGDISFMKNEADPDCFYNLYTAKNIGFVPIVNNTLVSYAGEKIAGGGKEMLPAIQGLTIDSKERNVGLFGTYHGKIADLMMTGTKVTGRNDAFAGTLIGVASGETSIQNVQVFLSQRLGDLVGAGLAPTAERNPEDVQPWVKGRIVGGLVGAYTTGKGLRIVNSSASTVLSGSKYAGGLVGAINAATVIDGSYADCYLKAEKTGGLIGTTGPGVSLSMYNFYAVGYQVATKAAAGLATYGSDLATYYPVRMENGYAACQIAKNQNTSVYNTVKNGSSVSASNVVYLSQNLSDEMVDGSRSVSYQELASDAIFQPTDSSGNSQPHLVSNSFTRQTTDIDNSSNPYNLMNQGLIKYSYPRLVKMRHYGDWNAEFENGALVYFEYNVTGDNKTYNFEGGNIYVNNIRRDDTQLNYQDRALVNGDGYALAFSGEQTVGALQVFYNGNKVTLGNSIRVGNYKLFPLNPNTINREDLLSDNFYQKLTVQYPVIDLTGNTTGTEIEKEETFYFNPHFAKCIGAGQTDVPDMVRIRSPRHLYALSKLFEKYQPLLKGSHSMISQDTDLDYGSYEWGNCYHSGNYDAQEPIGHGEVPFDLTYSGNGNTVTRLHIRTEENDAGLFGRISADGKVSDLVLLGDNETVTHFENTPEPDTGNQEQAANAEFSLVNGSGKEVNIGAIAGFNQGQIINCAVSGYSLDVRAYNGATANVGGLVGQNYRGFIRACTAETPRMAVKSYLANTYSGGLVGVNDGGSVYNSYAAGYIDMTEAETKDQDYTNIIAGLTGQNRSGNIFRCYAGMAMNAAGETQVYGLCKKGGSVIGSYYLDGGTYVYRHELYSFNSSQNKYNHDALAQGQPITAEKLSGMTLDEYGASQLTMNAGENPPYPYPATVSRRGVKVQYGYWPDNIKDFGQFGVFYWENEVGGNNAGLHMTMMGTNGGVQTPKSSTLCRAHNDGGNITAYGYGIFYKPQPNADDEGIPTLVPQNCVLGEKNTEVGKKLEAQMGEYKFIAYTTGVGDHKLHMTGVDGREEDNFAREANRNATWKLYYPAVKNGKDLDDTKSGVYTYSVSPFFGDAYSLESISLQDQEGSSPAKGYAKPGSKNCPYGVRAIDQLQFINWNYGKRTVNHYINAKFEGNKNQDNHRFPYLTWGNSNYPTAVGTGEDCRLTKRLGLNWIQQHDLDATGMNYTPIGSMYDRVGNPASNADGKIADADMAYFDSTYDGQAYVIKNINISSKAECVGLFGITVAAKLQNIVMYSDNGSVICHYEDRADENVGWYCIGGIAGLAGRSGDPSYAAESKIVNCTVSGYKLRDDHKSIPGWGGGNLAGLVGATTMNIERCSAVNDLIVNISYDKNDYINCRVGGLVAACRANITDCYVGGTITNTSNIVHGNGSTGKTSIWAAGICAGNVLRNQGNLQAMIGSTTDAVYLKNCYSYMVMPKSGTHGLKITNALASNGELQAAFADVANDRIYMENCFALDTAVQNANDYQKISKVKVTDWEKDNININSVKTDEKRGIFVTNHGRSPLVDYKEMQELTDVLKDFQPVSKSESGVATEGKFTFPGGDRMLEGLDYPFPAILTQNGKFVHYGAWPKLGIYWESKQATLDLVENHTAQGTRMLSAASLLIDYGDYASGEEEEEADQTPPADEKKPSEEPMETQNTSENQKPTETENTTVTDDPKNTKDPKNPEDPGNPENPEDPETPENPEAPETPENPEAPETPENPEAPETPENPEAPENPENPDGTEDDQNTRQNISSFAAVRMRGAAPLNAEGVNARLIHKLYVIGLTDVQGSDLKISRVDANNPAGGELDDTNAPAKNTQVGTLLSDGNGSYYPVEFQGIRPGSMKVTATVTRGDVEYSTSFILRVTAELNVTIQSDKDAITVYEGDTADSMVIALSDKKEKPFVPNNSNVTWKISLGGKENPIVSWTENAFMEPIMDNDGVFTGAYALHGIQGITAGEDALQLELSYKWPQDDQKDAIPVTGALSIPVTVHPSDVLGLGDNVSFNEITLPHSISNRLDHQDGTAKTYEEGMGPKRTGDGLYLYASNLDTSYTTLGNNLVVDKGFTVEKVQLKVGSGDYTDLDKQTREENAVSEVFKTQNDTYSFRVEIPDAEETEGVANDKFAYRLVLTDTNVNDQWSLKLTLKDKKTQKTYTLTYDRPNFVTFVFRTLVGETVQDTELKVLRVPQGSTIQDAYPDITEDSLSRELSDKVTLTEPKKGYHWTWKFPTEINKDEWIYQEEAPISYNVKYDPNYPSGFGLDAPMADSLFTYGSENRLEKATYTCVGYSFIGWAENADAAVPDYPMGTDGTFEATFKEYIKRKDGSEIHHGENLILYAVWKPVDYTITFDSGRCPEQEYKDEPVTVTWNISQASETIPKVDYSWDGYTLDGWTLGTDTTKVFKQGEKLFDVVRDYPREDSSTVYNFHAVWKPVDYTVTLNSDGVTLDPIKWNLDSPEDAKVGAPTREGYTFLGWAYTEDTTKADVTANTLLKDIVVQENVRADRTLYALWEPTTYTVTFRNGEETQTVQWSLGDTDADTATVGEIGNPEQEGFQGWTDTDGNPVPGETLIKAVVCQGGHYANRNLIADWKAAASTTSADEVVTEGAGTMSLQPPAKAPAPAPAPTPIPTPEQPEPDTTPTPDPETPADETGDEEETKETKETKETEEGDA